MKNIMNISTRDQVFLNEVTQELARARIKFPSQPRYLTLAALMEEVGELAQAALQHRESSVYGEAIQVAVMAMRVAIDTNPEER